MDSPKLSEPLLCPAIPAPVPKSLGVKPVSKYKQPQCGGLGSEMGPHRPPLKPKSFSTTCTRKSVSQGFSKAVRILLTRLDGVEWKTTAKESSSSASTVKRSWGPWLQRRQGEVWNYQKSRNPVSAASFRS